jgi:hypothetical protein
MAVTLESTGRPLFATQGDAVTGKKVVSHFRWYDVTAAGDDLIITDTAGNQIAACTAPVADYETIIPLEGVGQYVNGIIAATLDSGKLQAFYK